MNTLWGGVEANSRYIASITKAIGIKTESIILIEYAACLLTYALNHTYKFHQLSFKKFFFKV